MEGFRGPDNTSGFASNNINNNGETVQKDDKLHILFGFTRIQLWCFGEVDE